MNFPFSHRWFCAAAFSNFSLLIVSFSIFSACSSTPAGPQVPEPQTIQIPEAPVPQQVVEEIPQVDIPIDTAATQLARFLAGMDSSALAADTNFDATFWKEYSSRIDKQFAKIEKARLGPMQNWGNTNLEPTTAHSKTLYYPFSGADFIHANAFFPEVDTLVMMALERTGSLPNFDDYSCDSVNKYLAALNNSLRDLYTKSYFITWNMQEDMSRMATVDGLLPVFYFLIARSGFEIVSFSRIHLDSTGMLKQNLPANFASVNVLHGYQIAIKKPDEYKTRTLIYLKTNLSNKGFEDNPELALFIKRLGNVNTFLKSASYLLHYATFSTCRNLILNQSNSVVEDDTGIPFHHFNDSSWNANLYGIYVKPVRDFSGNLFQEDLQEAYQDSTLYRGDLPFSIGYHWGSKNQHLMFYSHK